MSCPNDIGPLLRLSFRGAGGARLARAIVDPTGCGAVTFRRRGGPTHVLAGGASLVRDLRPLLPARGR